MHPDADDLRAVHGAPFEPPEQFPELLRVFDVARGERIGQRRINYSMSPCRRCRERQSASGRGENAHEVLVAPIARPWCQPRHEGINRYTLCLLFAVASALKPITPKKGTRRGKTTTR